MNCLRVIALLAAICWSAVAAADTLTTNLTTYSTGDAITIVFTTTSLYETVAIDVNGIIVKTLTDTVNLITGTITYTGFVTCPMGTSGAVTSLVINATTTLPSNPPTITATTTVGYTYVAANCLAYFTTPSSNPATIPAAQQYTAAIATTTVAFTDAYITLNGQFFCSLGAVPASGTASCAGFVPCFLPCSAQFAIVGKETAAAYVTYPGPTVQLTPNASCNPVFSSEPGTGDSCPAPYTPLTTITFDFTISANDNIATYSNFEINATNSFLATPVFIAKVPGPLCVISEAPSTFIITKWLIPCEFNNLGATTFTLTYTQTLSGTEKILAAQTLSFTIGENIDCNLTLVVNTPGDCPLPYTPSDCQCLASSSGKGCSVVPCGNCPSCPSLSISPNSTFEPGDTLNFYVHNGLIPVITNNTITPSYYSGIFISMAVSSANFYIGSVSAPRATYKSLPIFGNTTTTIPYAFSQARQMVAYTSGGIDHIWLRNNTSAMVCGTTSSLVLCTDSGTTTASSPIAVGPLGTWILTTTRQLLHKPTVVCNDGNGFTSVLQVGNQVTYIASGRTVLYFVRAGQYYYLTSPSATPIAVPPGAPGSPSSMSASVIDDTLIVIDAGLSVWSLNSPTGQWLNIFPSSSYSLVATYDANTVYLYDSSSSVVDLVDPSKILFPYSYNSNFLLTLTSILPPLTLYMDDVLPGIDSCNNAFTASWTITSNYKNVGLVTATLSYDALFPGQVTPTSLVSSVSFTIGPTLVDSLKPRDFCPSATSSSTSSASAQLQNGCRCK